MKKKVLITAIIVIAIAIGAYYAFFNKVKEEYTLRTDKVGRGDIVVQVTSTGSISAVTTVDVGCQVSGIIKNIFADYNSVVKKGQIIAKIDSTNLIKALEDAKISLTKAQVNYDAGARNFERTKALFEKNLASQLDYDNALTTNESNKAALASAKAQLENAKVNLDYATIYAPLDGVIVNRLVNLGQTVNAGMSSPTLFSIANDLSQMQVQATIDEADIGKIDIGQEVTFTVDAFPEDKFVGTIYQVRLAPTVTQNVVNYTVIIDVKNDKLKLMPGMTANVKVKVAEKTGILRVPNMALRFTPPKEIQDTNKVKELMSGFRRGFGGGDQQAQNGNGQAQVKGNQQQAAQTQQPGKGEQTAQTQQQGDRKQKGQDTKGSQANMTVGERAQQFRGSMDFSKISAFRDSLTKAKGGNVSREDMFAAIQKRFGAQFGARRDQQTQNNQKNKAVVKQRVSGEAKNFGIDQKFSFYRKSSYSPADQIGFGRLWIKGATGLLEPVAVRTGITDGRYTEIYTDKLTEGQQIVIGATSNLSSSTTTTTSGQQQSPFQQQGGRGGMGGPGR